MADRYWVGGTDSWNTTAGLKWSTTSGGAGGASVPTSADDVFFSVLSTGTCSVFDNFPIKSLDFTGFAGTLAHVGRLVVGGNFTVSSLMTWSHSGTVEINGTGTLITAGKSFSNLTVNGSGITVTLGDALNVAFGRTLEITQGTFDTAGYSVAAGAFNATTGGAVKTINLNATTVTLGFGLTFTGATNLTLNAGTSLINLSPANATLAGNSKTFYNVTFTSSTGGRTIIGANTFNNLTNNVAGTGLTSLSIDSNQTVNGTLTCAGSSVTARGFLVSNTIGTTRTITAAVVSATNCDFRDITIAGAAAPISPTRGGDCGGNSGITFPAAKNAYRVGASASWVGSNSWALTSGGTGDNNNFPLAQDTAIIDNATTLTGTLSIASYNLGGLDCSTRTTGITVSFGSTFTIYKDFIFGSGVVIASGGTQTFSGRGTQTFTSAAKTITFPIIVDKPAGAFELGDAYNSSTTVTHTRGTFDAKTYNLTAFSFNSNNSNTRTINLGSGTWTLSGSGTVWNIGNSTGLTFNKGTANILLSNTSTTARNFQGGGQIYNKLTIGGATGISTLTIAQSNTFSEIESTKTVAHTILLGSNHIIGTWSVTGTVGNVVTLNSNSAGTRQIITLTNITSGIDFLSVKDIGITSPNLFYVGNNSIDGGNNLNVIFSSGPSPAVENSGMFFMFN